MMRITYLSHSGFLVELETAYLLFDYYKGDLPELNTGKKFYVFVSHAHYDHFKKDIFKLRSICRMFTLSCPTMPSPMGAGCYAYRP